MLLLLKPIKLVVLFILVSAALVIYNVANSEGSGRTANIPTNEELAHDIYELRSEISDIKALKFEINDLKRELAMLKQGEPANPKTSDAPINTVSSTSDTSANDDPFLGTQTSPLVIMAFLDYQCSPCRQFAAKILPKLRSEYIDTGKVQFVLRDYPLASNPYSRQAAVFASCAGEQGKYWEAFAALMGNPQELDLGNFDSIKPEVIGLDAKKFDNCFSSHRYESEIDKDVFEAKKLGAKGAPSFFIGKNVKESLDGILIRGAQPFPVFKHEIEGLLFQSRQT